MSNKDFKKLIEEYNLDYCYFLEAVYGKGMMSEGGKAAIENMFRAVDIKNKTALDIGSGLGGVALYLAQYFNMKVTGIDINPAMIEDAKQRIPANLIGQIHFETYDDISKLPFQDHQFDIVYSKGVLTHVKDKLPLFLEVKRILKPNGKLVINDWLSPVDNQWGENIIKMCEMENLTLYAVSPASYHAMLMKAGFKIRHEEDETQAYASYNQKQVDWLKEDTHAEDFKKKFGEKVWKEAMEAYELIAHDMEKKSLLVKNFVCSL